MIEVKTKNEVKACPKCHRIMKQAVVKGKNVWICLSCGIKVNEKEF